MSVKTSGCDCGYSLWREIMHHNDFVGSIDNNDPVDYDHPDVPDILDRLRNWLVAVSSEESFSPIESSDVGRFNLDARNLVDELIAAEAVPHWWSQPGYSFELWYVHASPGIGLGIVFTSTQQGFGTFPYYSWPIQFDASATNTTVPSVGAVVRAGNISNQQTISIGSHSYQLGMDVGATVFSAVNQLSSACQFGKERFLYGFGGEGGGGSVTGTGQNKLWAAPTLAATENGFPFGLNHSGYSAGGYLLPDRTPVAPNPFASGRGDFPSGAPVGEADMPNWAPIMTSGSPPTIDYEGVELYRIAKQYSNHGNEYTNFGTWTENLKLFDRRNQGEVPYRLISCGNRMPLSIGYYVENITEIDGGSGLPNRKQISYDIRIVCGRCDGGGQMVSELYEIDSWSDLTNEYSVSSTAANIPSQEERRSGISVPSYNPSSVSGPSVYMYGASYDPALDDDSRLLTFYSGGVQANDRLWKVHLDGSQISSLTERDLTKGYDSLYERSPTLAEINSINGGSGSKSRTTDSTRTDYVYRELYNGSTISPNRVSREIVSEGHWYNGSVKDVAFFNRAAGSNEAYFAVMFNELKDMVLQRYTVSGGSGDHVFAKTTIGDSIAGSEVDEIRQTVARTRLELYDNAGNLMKVIRREDTGNLARIPEDEVLGDFPPLPQGALTDFTPGGFGTQPQGYDNIDTSPGSINGANDRFIYFMTQKLTGDFQENPAYGGTVSAASFPYAINYLGEWHPATHQSHENETVVGVFGTDAFTDSNISEPIPLNAKQILADRFDITDH